MTRRSIYLTSAALALLVGACRDTEGPTPPTVASLSVSPSETTVLAGVQYSLSVTALGVDGAALAVQPQFSYSVDDTDIAAVDANGRVSALRAGTARIIVNVNGGATATSRSAVVRVGRDIGS